jgi:hypothetical protein
LPLSDFVDTLLAQCLIFLILEDLAAASTIQETLWCFFKILEWLENKLVPQQARVIIRVV